MISNHFCKSLIPYITTVATFAIVTFGNCHASESKNTSVTIGITFKDGKNINFETDGNDELGFKTCAGKLRFPCRSISRIEIPGNSEADTVHLSSGDRWRTIIDNNFLKKLNVKRIKKMINLHGAVTYIKFNSLPQAHIQAKTHYMKLIMNDGSQALIDPTELLLPLETMYGERKISIGSLRAIKFITSPEYDAPDSVIIRFHTGFVKRMKLNGKNYLRTIDCSGNILKIYHQDIMGILSSTKIEDSAIDSSETDSVLNTYQIKLKDDHEISVSLPISIWKFKTDTGTMHISTPMISNFQSNAEENKPQILTTVFGEIFSGKLMMRQIQTANKYNDKAYIDIDDINIISTDTAIMQVPEKWLVWYLKSGTAMIGRFADTTGLYTGNDLEIQADAITALSPATDNSSFVNITKDGEATTYNTKSKRVKIVLLTTGMTISIPWKDVCIVKSQKVITEESLQNLPVAIETESDDENENVYVDETERNIKLKTAIGKLELQPNSFAKITIDKSASKACVTSIYDDKFITSIPTRKWFEDLQNINDYEYPEEELFEINLRESQTPTPKNNTFVCRLTTGDILYGELPKQEIHIKKRDSKSAPIKVNVNKLQQISRDDEGCLIFHLQRGNILATPKQKQLEIVLFATGNTNRIAFKKIESLIVNSSKLPPTTCFYPGMPAAMKNEILVKGGSFMQGSESGMPDERPVHTTSISSFYMDSTEVTRAQFAAFIRDTGYETLAEQTESRITWKTPGFIQRQTDPVVCISWNDAIEYCNWRSNQANLPVCYTIDKDATAETDRTAMGYRLPTESEWEFAARNRGQNNTYAWDNKYANSTTLANYQQEDLSEDKWVWTNPVQTFPANGLGIFGLSGNVWEWCEDIYFSKAYSTLRNNQMHNPCITSNSAPGHNRRTMRGGSFKNRLDLLRCTSRGNGQPYAFSNHVGFRCTRNHEDEE